MGQVMNCGLAPSSGFIPPNNFLLNIMLSNLKKKDNYDNLFARVGNLPHFSYVSGVVIDYQGQ